MSVTIRPGRSLVEHAHTEAPALPGDAGLFLRGDGVYAAPPGGSLADGDYGDVTASVGGTVITIDLGAVTLAKIAAIAAARILGSIAGGAPAELTGTQVTALLDAFTAGLRGLVPASGGGVLNFLRADGAWTAPGGGSVASGTAELDFGAGPNEHEATAVVADAGVAAGSEVIAIISGAATGDHLDSEEIALLDISVVSFAIVAGVGFSLRGWCGIGTHGKVAVPWIRV